MKIISKINKPIILTFTGSYLPGYRGGGPIRSIANLVNKLGFDFDFRIVTCDRDLNDKCPYENLNSDTWCTVGKAQVYYARPATLGVRGIRRLLRDTEYDLLYLNSFFSPVFTIIPILLMKFGMVPYRPIIIAPRGEFSSGALKIKRLKKKLFIVFFNLIGLYRLVIWHASSNFELIDILRSITHSKKYSIAPNILVGPDLVNSENLPQDFSCKTVLHGSKLRICFLSRISPKKNLDFALKVISNVRTNIEFHIYGPIEDKAYWKICQDLIPQLPNHVYASYKGTIEHSQVINTIAKYDLFFLPTHGENFGHVFIESWAAGVPILISDQTPWRDLKNRHLGWDISLDDFNCFVRVLEEFAMFDKNQRLEMRHFCLAYAQYINNDNDSLEANRRLFKHALKLKQENIN